MGVYHSKPRISRVWFGGAVVWVSHNLLNGPGIHFVHAGRAGRPLLLRDVTWRTINGVLIRTRNTQTFLHFRRLPYLPRA